MKKKIFFYACFLLIGCFIGINIKEFKSKYVDASEEEKGLYIKYGERFPIETFNALGEKKNQKHGNTPLYKIWLYIDPNCESCIEKFPVVERLTEIMQGENIEIDILWRQEPKKTLVDTLDISKDKQYRTGSIKVLNEYPTYFITDEENSVQMISDDIDKIVKKMLSLDEIEKNAIIKETNIYLKKLRSNFRLNFLPFALATPYLCLISASYINHFTLAIRPLTFIFLRNIFELIVKVVYFRYFF